VNFRSIGAALVDLCSSEMTNEHSCFALDIDYEINDDGTPDFNNAKSIIPVSWNDWIKLKVREWDFAIHSPNMIIRAPTVTVAMNYTKMPMKLFRKKPTKDGIWIRDGGICQYTNKKLDRKSSSIDHIIPRSKHADKSAADSWTNMVLCDKDINFKKGNKFNKEVGLELIREPKVPKPMPASETITEAKHHSWIPFLTNTK
jgi:5-methylcytosine-specific restriction endonuclease McrA